MAEVGEKGFLRGEAGGNGAGFGDGEVGGVGDIAECVDDQEIKISHESQGGFRDAFYIREVANTCASGRLKQQTYCLYTAMEDGKGGDAKVADVERGADNMGIRLDVASVGILVVESPAEHVFQHGQCGSRGIEGQGGIALPAEGAHLVEAGYVVEVGVGIDYCVDLRDLFP